MEIENMLKGTRVFLVAMSIIFIALGIFQGEVQQVFVKATLVCLECIGIG
jgi:hypothetical protein